MKDYGRKSTFASFLPGIAGVKGIPIWCYYVNRGQAVVSFGVDNKDHAIMEFYPAHLAYQNVKKTGFRTFIKKDGAFYEPFSKESLAPEMIIGMNTLKLVEINEESGLKTEVCYYILPEENVGALVRQVKITNISNSKSKLEMLDGMPALICYGVGQDSMKNMTQTTKAWMQVEHTDDNVPIFRVRASMDDSAAVSEILGGNFSLGFEADGSRLSYITDPEVIFGYDTSMETPVNFLETNLDDLLTKRQNMSNVLPCSFFALNKELEPGQEIQIAELVGQVNNVDKLGAFVAKKMDSEFFEAKLKRAEELTEELGSVIETHTGNEHFDEYCKYTFMDNVLRGGFPIRLGNNKIFYVYSRKHGDLERDYNYYSMLPEFYSQGNGNFRDVNQNRRCDTFFAPYVGRENIYTFYSFVQLDGYNPLGVEKLTYTLDKSKAEMILEDLPVDAQGKITKLVTGKFTPGSLYMLLMELVDEAEVERYFTSIIDFSEGLVNGNFGEGYWSDHWDYNLDLVENYLAVFPEKEQEMLYEKAYSFFLSQASVLPRKKRYVETEKGIRQYNFLDEENLRDGSEKLVRTNYGKGEVLYTTLIEKLVILSALKYATLDSNGMGIEMEGGKPGWYDALNGIPGILGSSMAETYELSRMLDYTVKALRKYPCDVELLCEVYDLVKALSHVSETKKDSLDFWNRSNDVKEAYREKVFAGVSGATTKISSEELAQILDDFKQNVDYGIKKAFELGKGICPTYFYYEVTSYEKDSEGIMPTEFELKMVPYFLEGPVRYLKLSNSKENKKALYDNVKNSDLYDEKLSMYKVNASLQDATYELGRARAFTPGWLENESVFLHMEYKYLLETLKSKLYEEFAEDLHKAGIPFLSEEMYGRSTLENSSFLASSKNPNPDIHGKGFVARLSGSTVEFLNMWRIMMFGATPFKLVDGELTLCFEPMIPEYLIAADNTVSAKFLGSTNVVYHLGERRNYFPGDYEVANITLVYKNNTRAEVNSCCLDMKMALAVRDGQVSKIEVTLK